MRVSELARSLLLEVEAIVAIRNLLQEGRPLLVAYSGGKDSTVTLALALNAARRMREDGRKVPPILVTHGNTGVENPMVSLLAEKEMAKVRAFGKKHGLTVRAEVAHPSLCESWAVSILSGRKLPTFVNAQSRDCSNDYKVKPMERLRKRLLAELGAPINPKGKRSKAEGAAGVSPRPVTLIGTRFEESANRAGRMTERGESALVPWEKNNQLFLSPIANWTGDDVWEYIGRMRSGEVEAFTDGREVFDLYASAGGSSCAVVADMATEGLKSSRACGARFGCAVCVAVGRDKSLENMMEIDPGYGWLRGVNHIQRFLLATQWDLERRNWLGRARDEDGFLGVGPDAYSPGMVAELLRYCLTVDADEQRAARAAGLDGPRFQLVTPQQIVAIDAFWGIHAVHDEPFAAIKIWLDVHAHDKRYYPPQDLVAFPRCKLPPKRYFLVGDDWDEGQELRYSGMRDPVRELVAQDGPSANRVLPSGREVLSFNTSPSFEVDQEGAVNFLALLAEDTIDSYRHSPSNRSFFFYVSLGILSATSGHVGELDEIMKRATWKRRRGLTGHVRHQDLVPLTLSKAERLSREQRIAQGKERVGPPEPIPLRARICHPVYL